MSLLELKQVTKKYSTDAVAVNNVDLTVQPGELLALTGESGCGKTTLLRLIAGLERPDHGEINLDNHTVASKQVFVPPQQRPVGLVFQDYALFPHMNVAQNIKFGLKSWSSAERKERVTEMLHLVNLSGLEKRYPHQLSGGQQQRVAIARALAPKPRLLLLDEPFSNLDTLLKDQVREDISTILRRAGTTAILVTHDVQDAMSMADRIAVFKEGRLLQIDRPRILYQQPLDTYVASFFGRVNLIPVVGTASGVTSEIGQFFLENADGKTGFLCLRPQQIKVNLSRETAASAEVISVKYLGDYQQLEIRSGNCRLCCHQPLSVSFHSGQTIHLDFDLEQVHVIWVDS